MTNVPFGSMGAHDGYEAATVRPYAVTGGRVRSATSDLPLEALVEVMPGAVNSFGLPPEKRSILQHAAHTYVSIAELSALLRLRYGASIADAVADLGPPTEIGRATLVGPLGLVPACGGIACRRPRSRASHLRARVPRSLR